MDEDYSGSKHLLSEIEKIVSKNETVKAERAKRGEFFNIFNVLKIGGNEVRLHSAFLAELLNPEGSHGLGNIFLVEFLKKLKVDNFQTNGAKNILVILVKIIQKAEDWTSLLKQVIKLLAFS